MQCVCKTIRFNFEPTLSSNKICLYGRRFKKKKKRARDRRRGTGDWVNSYSSGWQKPSVWCHPVSLFSIMCRGWKQTAATLCWIKSGENAANQRVALNSSREKMALDAHVALRLSEVAGVFFFFFGDTMSFWICLSSFGRLLILIACPCFWKEQTQRNRRDWKKVTAVP